MKTAKKRLGVIVLGAAIVLAGCGDEQPDEVSGTGSVETDTYGTEVNAWTEHEQGGQGQNILEYTQSGDALYKIAATFELEFIAGDSGKLGTETGWTIEEMLKTLCANNKDANALGRVGVNTAQEFEETRVAG